MLYTTEKAEDDIPSGEEVEGRTDQEFPSSVDLKIPLPKNIKLESNPIPAVAEFTI